MFFILVPMTLLVASVALGDRLPRLPPEAPRVHTTADHLLGTWRGPEKGTFTLTADGRYDATGVVLEGVCGGDVVDNGGGTWRIDGTHVLLTPDPAVSGNEVPWRYDLSTRGRSGHPQLTYTCDVGDDEITHFHRLAALP
jgi:hypothetical protein